MKVWFLSGLLVLGAVLVAEAIKGPTKMSVAEISGRSKVDSDTYWNVMEFLKDHKKLEVVDSKKDFEQYISTAQSIKELNQEYKKWMKTIGPKRKRSMTVPSDRDINKELKRARSKGFKAEAEGNNIVFESPDEMQRAFKAFG